VGGSLSPRVHIIGHRVAGGDPADPICNRLK
jgi:hypothetical protein